MDHQGSPSANTMLMPGKWVQERKWTRRLEHKEVRQGKDGCGRRTKQHGGWLGIPLSNYWEKSSREIELWGWPSLHILSFILFLLLFYSLPFLKRRAPPKTYPSPWLCASSPLIYTRALLFRLPLVSSISSLSLGFPSLSRWPLCLKPSLHPNSLFSYSAKNWKKCSTIFSCPIHSFPVCSST